MGARYYMFLEHDGVDPERYDFVCDLDEIFSPAKNAGIEFYSNDDLQMSPTKKHSKELEEITEARTHFVWGFDIISTMMRGWKEQLRTREGFGHGHYGYEDLAALVEDMQNIVNTALKTCDEKGLDPKKCHLFCWHNF